MGAAIHSSALQQQPQLGAGCVLLLQNVSVLTPNPGSCYLAVTADNISKVCGATKSAWLNAAPGCSTSHDAERLRLTAACAAGIPNMCTRKHVAALQSVGCSEC
jgi:hypothetical protein